MKRSILGGRLLDPANSSDTIADLHLADGVIVAQGPAPEGFVADETLDATDCWVMPGIIDLAARLREPGATHKTTIASEARAALANGITTVVLPPDTSPVIDSPAVVELIQRKAQAAEGAEVAVLGALTQGLAGEALSEMAALKAAGCVGVCHGGRPLRNSQVLRRAMEYAAGLGLTVFLQPEDSFLRDNGCAHEGPVAARLGLAGIPAAAETAGLARDLDLVAHSGARTHFCRLSTARAVEMIADAQARGLPVTADVAAHQLHLTEADIDGFNAQCHVYPPLRSAADRDALRQGLAEGVITAVCSDHQPHEPDAKLAPFPVTEAGISALDTLLPLMLELVATGALTAQQMVARLSHGPARVLGRAAPGLAVGSDAALLVVEPARQARLTAERMRSHRQNSPFLDQALTGQLRAVLQASGYITM